MLEESGGGFSTWDEIFFYIFFSSNRIRVLYRKKIAVALKVGTYYVVVFVITITSRMNIYNLARL